MIFGKYQLLELLGRGGMAEVFKAKSYGVEGFEKLLVIKRILPVYSDNEAFVEMFINEAKIAVSLNHANIVQIFDLGKAGESYYIAMEYVMGLDLAGIVRRLSANGRRVPPEIAAYIGSEIAKGLDYAHRRRGPDFEPLHIIHRDISPHNILISHEGEIKITDFGIARARSTAEGDSSIKGKFAYMAPEQAIGATQDQRVDIFSLGVVLFETLMGVNPFKGLNNTAILKKIQQRDYPELNVNSVDGRVPEALNAIVRKAMAPDPEDRYKHAAELYEALISWLYSSGARVGAHNISDFIEPLRHQSDPNPEGEVGKFSRSGVSGTGGVYSQLGDLSHHPTSIVPPNMIDLASMTVVGPIPGDEICGVAILVAQLPESCREERHFEQLRRLITSMGGSILEMEPNGLTAVFGPGSRSGREMSEALNCALDLRRSIQEHHILAGIPSLNLGVAHGHALMHDEVLVRSGALEESADQARRAAETGARTVAVPADQLHIIESEFEFTSIPPQPPEQFNAIEIVGRLDSPEAAGKFIGRREELRAIGELLAHVSQGSGKVLAVTGRTGIGKTRVLQEVRRRLEAGGHQVNWYEISVVPWRRAFPYSALTSMIHAILGIHDLMADAAILERIGRLRELSLSADEINAITGLLGLPVPPSASPNDTNRLIQSGLIRAVRQLARDRLTVLFFDDLNDIDADSLRVLHHLSRHITHSAVLLALSVKRGFSHGFEASANLVEISMSEFTDEDSRRLALARLGIQKAPAPLLDIIVNASEGNPLHIETYIRALFATGAIRLKAGNIAVEEKTTMDTLPGNLRGLIIADINALPTAYRSLLQYACVIGHCFDLTLLSGITDIPRPDLDHILERLAAAHQLRKISNEEYSFVSVLVKDTLFQCIAQSDRRRIHHAIATTLEKLFEGRVDEVIDRVAVHYENSYARDKAIQPLLRAARKLKKNCAHRSASEFFLKALDILHDKEAPDLKLILEIYLEVGALCVLTNAIHMGLQKMKLAEELALQLNDSVSRAMALQLKADLLSRTRDLGEADQCINEAISIADSLDNAMLRVRIRLSAGEIHLRNGAFAPAIDRFVEALALCPTNTDPNTLITCYAQLALARASTGEGDLAHESLESGRALLNQHTTPAAQCNFYRAQARVCITLKDFEGAVQHYEQALQIATESDLHTQMILNTHSLGDVLVGRGDYRRAFSYLRQSRELALDSGDDRIASLNGVFLDFIDALKFGSNEGLQRLEAGLKEAEERNSAAEQIQIHFFLGRIYTERRNSALAREHLEQSLQMGIASENLTWVEQTRLLLDELLPR